VARRGLYVDITLCMGCRTCEAVCEFLHGEKLINVYEPLPGIFTPITCRHCERAPCIEVCPTAALERDTDGAVIVNPRRCIGCMMCTAVCPFGVPSMSAKSKSVVKCDMCRDLRLEGLPPACAQMCPATAIVFGSIETLADKARARTAEILARIRLLRAPVRPFIPFAPR